MLTPEEVQIIEYGKSKGKTPQESIKALEKYRMSQQGIAPQPDPEMGFGEDLVGDVKQVGTDIKNTIVERGNKQREIMEAQASGKQGALSTGFQTATNFLGTIGGVVGSAIKGGVKAILPQKAEDKTKEVVTNLGNKIMSTPEAKQWMQNLNDLKKSNPEMARNIIATMEGGEFLLEFAGLKAAKTGVEATMRGARIAAEAGVEGGKKLANQTIDTTKGGLISAKNKLGTMAERPIEAQVKTSLGQTKTNTFDKYVKTAQEAAVSNKNKTPLELAGESAQGALDTVQRKLNSVGEQKSGVMNQASVGNKPVGNIALKYRQGLNNFIKSGNLVEGDRGLLQRIATRAEALGSNPSAKQVDQFIDYVQNEIYSSKRNLTIPVTDSTTGALRKLTGELNEALKSQLPKSYRNLNQKYSELIEVRNELNSKLGYEGEKGGSLMKRVFSPSDAGTKKLFQEVLKLTGVDLVNEATVAKFLMETLGDARQISILEKLQLPSLSPRGNLQLAKEWLSKKLNTPEKIIQRARELTKEVETVSELSKKEFRYADSIKSTATVGEVQLSRFDGKNIIASQNTVERSGVNKWKKRIETGERPAVLVEFSERRGGNIIVDGHTRLTAYKELGIENIPVIDNTGKFLENGLPIKDYLKSQ